MRLLHQIPPNTYDDDLALTPRDGPQAVLGLLSDVTRAALAANIYLLHPTDVEFAAGKPTIVLTPIRPERSLSMAPEVLQGGPVPATLSYSVGAIASLATLGTLEPAPETAELHRVWVEGLRERLKTTWSGLPGADATIDIIARCMVYDPGTRPHPKNVLEEVVQLEALLQRIPTAPSITAPDPEPTPAPAAAPSASRSLSGALPATVPLSHPLVPYAMLTVVLAGSALAVALCTFGAVMGQFADLVSNESSPATVIVPAAAPTEHPGVVGVSPASLFDRFDRAQPLAPAPVGVSAGTAATEPPPPQAVVPEMSANPFDAPASPEPAREPARGEPATGPTLPPDLLPPVRQRPVESAPFQRDPEVRPKAAPGSDLRDPWDR